MASVPLVAQQPLNWAAEDGNRIATLAKDGGRLESEHVILWFPRSLAAADAEALLKRLDPGVAGLWSRVGTHDWQSVKKGRITYYLSDDAFVAHASGRAAVFVPMARVRDGHAPFLHEATHELLASTRTDRTQGGTRVQRPLWLTEGLPDYISRLAAADVEMTEAGPFDTPTIAGVDDICAERARTTNGATMMPYIGGDGRPEVLFTTERSRFAPTFYACSFSLVKSLADQVGLNELINLFGFTPADMNARLDRLGSRSLFAWRAEWLARLKLPM